MSVTQSHFPLVSGSQPFEFKGLSISSFVAETTTAEKVKRVVNNFAFIAGMYSFYLLTRWEKGLLTRCEKGFCLTIGLIAPRIAQALVGYYLYPIAFTSFPFCKGVYVAESGKRNIAEIKSSNFIVKKVSLYKSGIKYDAALITHPDTMKNGNWIIHALAHPSPMEYFISSLAWENYHNNCNTLLVNGPSVMQSGGWPTRYQMGAGFEAGIRFLEKVIQATHIIMCGHFFGGGTMREAIINHDFTEGMRNGIRYLSITDRSFSRLSATAGPLLKWILYITGMEFDGVGAAHKLSQLKIQQIIIQHRSEGGTGSDGMTPDTDSLAYELHKDSSLKHIIFLESELITHQSIPKEIKDDLKIQIEKFIRS